MKTEQQQAVCAASTPHLMVVFKCGASDWSCVRNTSHHVGCKPLNPKPMPVQQSTICINKSQPRPNTSHSQVCFPSLLSPPLLWQTAPLRAVANNVSRIVVSRTILDADISAAQTGQAGRVGRGTVAVVVKGCNGCLNISRRGPAVGQTAAGALQWGRHDVTSCMFGGDDSQGLAVLGVLGAVACRQMAAWCCSTCSDCLAAFNAAVAAAFNAAAAAAAAGAHVGFVTAAWSAGGPPSAAPAAAG